jgi:cell division protein FtsZ
MKTSAETSETSAAPLPGRAIKIFGIGGAGVILSDALNHEEFAGATFVALDTDAAALAASTAPVKIHLESKLLRGLGTGGDPERGRALAEEQFATLQAACDGARAVFIAAGLGGGAGSGVAPVLARAAREAGALTLAFVTLPFACEGNRRRQQAEQGLEQLRSAADGVVTLPSQKLFKFIDENTSVLDTFRIADGLLAEGVRGIWQLLTRPGLIQIHFDDVCAVLRDGHAESAFAFVEAAGPARSREAVEKLLRHPLLDEGRALAEAETILISLLGGRDLTMAEVNRVMEQIGRQGDRARIVMGATLDAAMKDKLAVTLIAARNASWKSDTPPVAADPETLREAGPRYGVRPAPPPVTLEPDELMAARRRGARREKPRMLQTQLPLTIVTKGRFDKSEPTIHQGEDLDIPTFVRRGVPLN